MFEFWPDSYQMSFQLVRGMATAPWGGAEVGECLKTAERIRPEDYESWHQAWLDAADAVERLGQNAVFGRHFASAREAFGRASQYYRLAEFFLELHDERKLPVYSRLQSCFAKYVSLLHDKPEPVQLPYGDSFLSAYFLRHSDPYSGARAPAVIATGGLDSLAEEVYFAAAIGLAERGFHVLVLDGPGQGESLRRRNLPAVANFEEAVTPAVDYLEHHPLVDPGSIALIGYSLGGYYVARAAAYESRLKALIIWGAQWDYGEVWRDRTDDHPLARHLRMILGTQNMDQARRKVADFNLGGVAEQIRCPTLVTHGEEDRHVPVTHAHRVHNALRCPKKLKIFTADEGGDAHCQWDNLRVAHHYMFGWLQDAIR
jgi:dienelactone hydrolase